MPILRRKRGGGGRGADDAGGLRYSTPMMDRVSIEVETVYCNDAGDQPNIFNLKGEELKNRTVDVMDFVVDPISSADYLKEEDPKLFRSRKTGRGPLTDDWVQECVQRGRCPLSPFKYRFQVSR